MPKVTMIPATINPLTHLPSVAARKRHVAGYARVSTESDEQFTSYEAQVDYYTKFIQSNRQPKCRGAADTKDAYRHGLGGRKERG